MNKLILTIIFSALVASAAAAVRTTDDLRVPSQGIRGTVSLNGTTTATLALSNGVTGIAPLSGASGTVTFSDRTTGTLTLAVNDGSSATTGTLNWGGIPGTLSFAGVPAAAAHQQTFQAVRGPGFVQVNFITADSGNSSGTLQIDGTIQAVRFVNGSPCPTALWDCMIKADADFDALAGQGANVTTATTAVHRVPYLTVNSHDYLIPTSGNHAVSITNAGARKAGSIRIYVK